MEVLDDYSLGEEQLSEKEADWKLFIGKKFDYYRPIWQKIEAGNKIQFNVYAFFFWSGWAGYRKMYQIYFILVALKLLSDYIPHFLNFPPPAASTVSILFFGVYLFWGFNANFIYYKHATKKIAQIKSTGLSKVLEETSLRNAGQEDMAFPLGAGFIIFILVLCLNSVLGIL
ncbi:MAG: Unknown protein [uncultured Aureispira sp.]|uniref:DUF2628 domain-containing protein n=1 Tax=uncultured Aureispira sp. TaxID=1331704 RepID=A0A6S6RTZ0_9BACT|nr:MAG: Unknown protein [uncultured Aureispira sp.]